MPKNPRKATPAPPSAKESKAVEKLLEVVEVERQRIFRAQAIAQTAASLLHQSFEPEENEPDLGYVLDAICDMLEHAVTALDGVTLTRA